MREEEGPLPPFCLTRHQTHSRQTPRGFPRTFTKLATAAHSRSFHVGTSSPNLAGFTEVSESGSGWIRDSSAPTCRHPIPNQTRPPTATHPRRTRTPFRTNTTQIPRTRTQAFSGGTAIAESACEVPVWWSCSRGVSTAGTTRPLRPAFPEPHRRCCGSSTPPKRRRALPSARSCAGCGEPHRCRQCRPCSAECGKSSLP